MVYKLKEEKMNFNKELDVFLTSCPRVREQLESHMNGHEIKNQNVIGLANFLMKDETGIYSVAPSKINEFKEKVLNEETRLEKIEKSIAGRGLLGGIEKEFPNISKTNTEEDQSKIEEDLEKLRKETEGLLALYSVPTKTEVEGLAEARRVLDEQSETEYVELNKKRKEAIKEIDVILGSEPTEKQKLKYFMTIPFENRIYYIGFNTKESYDAAIELREEMKDPGREHLNELAKLADWQRHFSQVINAGSVVYEVNRENKDMFNVANPNPNFKLDKKEQIGLAKIFLEESQKLTEASLKLEEKRKI